MIYLDYCCSINIARVAASMIIMPCKDVQQCVAFRLNKKNRHHSTNSMERQRRTERGGQGKAGPSAASGPKRGLGMALRQGRPSSGQHFDAFNFLSTGKSAMSKRPSPCSPWPCCSAGLCFSFSFFLCTSAAPPVATRDQ